MVKENFPFNYFSVWLSPTKMFQQRKSLNWLQICIVLLFLLALNILPVPFHYQQQKSMPLDIYLPHVQKMLQKNEDELEKLGQTAKFANGQYHFSQEKIVQRNKKDLVGVAIPQMKVKTVKNAVVLNDHFFLFKEKGNVSKIYYSDDYAPQKGLRKQLNQEWYQRNKAAISFAMLQSIGSLFLLTNLVFVFGGGFMLWLGRKSPMITISSFKETVNLMVNILGPISLLVAIMGFIKFDISLLMTVQMLGAVLVFLMVYAKTRFNDANNV